MDTQTKTRQTAKYIGSLLLFGAYFAIIDFLTRLIPLLGIYIWSSMIILLIAMIAALIGDLIGREIHPESNGVFLLLILPAGIFIILWKLAAMQWDNLTGTELVKLPDEEDEE